MKSEAQPTPTETLLGVGAATVRHADGRTEAVTLRQLPVRQLPDLLAALDDEARMLELFTGKPAAWVDALPPAEFERLLAEGERLNADFFGRWLARRLDRQEKLMPGLTDRLLARGLPPSPTPPPSSPSKSA